MARCASCRCRPSSRRRIGAGTDETDGGHMRVLLVEDEAPLRETLAARLKRDGFAVDAAGDGEEGLYLGREVPFDVAIIDLGLPKLSGMDLVKQLREAGQRYPILILTARS